MNWGSRRSSVLTRTRASQCNHLSLLSFWFHWTGFGKLSGKLWDPLVRPSIRLGNEEGNKMGVSTCRINPPYKCLNWFPALGQRHLDIPHHHYETAVKTREPLLWWCNHKLKTKHQRIQEALLTRNLPGEKKVSRNVSKFLSMKVILNDINPSVLWNPRDGIFVSAFLVLASISPFLLSQHPCFSCLYLPPFLISLSFPPSSFSFSSVCSQLNCCGRRWIKTQAPKSTGCSQHSVRNSQRWKEFAGEASPSSCETAPLPVWENE